MLTRALIAVACIAIGGCTTMSEFSTSVRKETLRNDQGHVIGYKNLLRNERTGEVLAQVTLYTPMYGDDGEIVGYEEPSTGGTIVRDPYGQRIGARFADLRSRGTNARNKGVLIVIRPAEAPQVAAKETEKLPLIQRLLASFRASDLRRVQ